MTRDPSQKTILILSQVYVPDPASVGQHMADAAAEMVRRGHRVIVYTANRGFDDPSVRYKSRETIDGVDVRRLPLSSFGKKSILVRLIGGISFMLQCIVRGLTMRHLSGMMISTSPPMCSVAAVIIGTLRRVPIKYWVMDLNPDQMIALGKIEPTAMSARLFDRMNRAILRRASNVIALDRFMAERLEAKEPLGDRLAIMPPWPHDDHLERVEHADNPFRKRHSLGGKFVIMYSGNHSIASPLTTILDAALRLQDDDRIVFMFVGGGLGKKEVDDLVEHERPRNIMSLPYQPLSQIKYSLSAADVHLVALGDPMVGCIHPCKIYGAMAVGRPVLLLGPHPSHASEIIEESDVGWHIPHGDVDNAVETIRRIANIDPETLREIGDRAAEVIRTRLSKDALCGAFCDILEQGLS